ncbi:MAG: hypothetical protein JO149_07860, partial [Gammaproteobacteria bacterium]|nr:hypothetical protein [Gammaproteobacteria bacterium]
KFTTRVEILRAKAYTFFGIGASGKANDLENALKNAESCKAYILSVAGFLNHASQGEKSILQVLHTHRISFTGETDSIAKDEELQKIIADYCTFPTSQRPRMV